MKCATNRLIPKWNGPDHSESWTENHLHSGRQRTCRTTMMVPLKWQGKLSIVFEPCHHLRTYCSFHFCYKLATNMLICCPISDKMVLIVVSACFIADYLYPNFLWKPFAIYLSLSVSFISTSLAQPYCMAYTSLSFACPTNECYHFCLTRFGLVFMIFFWTSSLFLIHIGECRLSYCIDKNFSISLQLFIVFFECWLSGLRNQFSAKRNGLG